MNRRISVTACLVLAACAAKRAPELEPESKPAEIFDGIYRFSESPQPLQQPIEGTMTVLRDTVFVDAQPGPCRYEDKLSWGTSSIVYRCAEIMLSFDRANPVRNSKFRGTVKVDERRTVCVRYEINSSGRRVCVQQDTQIVQREVNVSGILHPARVTRAP